MYLIGMPNICPELGFQSSVEQLRLDHSTVQHDTAFAALELGGRCDAGKLLVLQRGRGRRYSRRTLHTVSIHVP